MHSDDEIVAYQLVENLDTNRDNHDPNICILSMTEDNGNRIIKKADSFFDQGDGVAGFQGGGGFVEWKITSGSTADKHYWIFCQMTAHDSRPLCLSVNGTVVSTNICEGTTGTWGNEGLQWFHHGPFAAPGCDALTTVRIDSDGFWPHVKRFVLIPTSSATACGVSKRMKRTTERTPQAASGEPIVLQKPSHAGVAEKLASIPDRQQPSKQQLVGVMRKPKNMSSNVEVGNGMIVVEGSFGFYEFEFINEVWAHEVYLDVTYSSGDSRPVILTINGGDAVDEGSCETTTDGYSPENFIHERCGPYAIKTEVNTVKVSTRDGYFPHIAEIRAVDANTEDETPTRLSLGTWIVPPSRPLRPDLLPQLRDLCFVENTQEPNPGFVPDPDFYNGINLDGLWVLASKQVETRVLHQAAQLLSRYIPIEIRQLCLQWRAPVGMPRGPFRVLIMDHVTNQRAGDCPDFPSEWDGRNGTANPGIFTSADDFQDNPRFGPCGDLTVHEVTHGLDMVIRQQLDPYFFQECDEAYCAATERQTYRKAYAASDRHEYLAEICTLFVGTGPGNFKRGCSQCAESSTQYCDHEPHLKFPPGAEGVNFTLKSDLVKNDTMGYDLLKSFLVEIKERDDDSFWWQQEEKIASTLAN